MRKVIKNRTVHIKRYKICVKNLRQKSNATTGYIIVTLCYSEAQMCDQKQEQFFTKYPY